MASTQAYRKAASRISPKLSPTTLSKIGKDMERAISRTAPVSAFSIPYSVRYDPFAINHPDGSSSNPYAHADKADSSNNVVNPSAVIRAMGTSRRVFVLNPSCSPTEIDGLSYHLKCMGSNAAINSIVIANPMEDAECNGDMSENTTVLPSFMEDEDPTKNYYNRTSASTFGPYGKRQNFIKSILHERFGDGLGMPYVSSGYDAHQIYKMGMHADASRLDSELLVPLISLSKSVRGSYDESINHSESKVPVITMPHGLVTDAGYSLLLGSYVLATHSTSFQILNPLRGLSFDPVGLSYLLPRVGWEFGQPSAEYSSAIASILALTGYEANAEDMVSTGLATHYIGGPFKLNLLERALSELNSFEYQSLVAPPKRLYGRKLDEVDGIIPGEGVGVGAGMGSDVNAQFKNVAVANLIQHVSEYDAAGADEYGVHLRDDLDDETGLFLKDADPSVTLPEERIQLYGELVSELVNSAATFRDAFAEPTVEGIMERLREIAATKGEFEGKLGYEEDVMVAEQAQSFVVNMEQRSPLALCVTNQLLRKGMDDDETLESCMERERVSQLRLFTKENGDYVRWAESGSGVGLVEMTHGNSSLIRKREDMYSGWKHASVKDVTNDEIQEIVG
jgi:enoyl-CoA hydratase/carnithine racemase